MSNYWLNRVEVKKLVRKLEALFKPYEDTYYPTMDDVVDAMNTVLSVFLKNHMNLFPYMRYVEITYVSTSFLTTEGPTCRFDGCAVDSLI